MAQYLMEGGAGEAEKPGEIVRGQDGSGFGGNDPDTGGFSPAPGRAMGGATTALAFFDSPERGWAKGAFGPRGFHLAGRKPPAYPNRGHSVWTLTPGRSARS